MKELRTIDDVLSGPAPYSATLVRPPTRRVEAARFRGSPPDSSAGLPTGRYRRQARTQPS